MPDYNRIPGIDLESRFHPTVLEAMAEEPILEAAYGTPVRLSAYGVDLREAGYTNNWNEVTDSGWYKSPDGLNAPTLGFYWYIGEVMAESKQFVTQTLTGFATATAGNTQTWRRHKLGETWTAWFKLNISQAEQDARYLVNAENAPKGLAAIINREVNSTESRDQFVVDSIRSFTFKAMRWYTVSWNGSVVNRNATSPFCLAQIWTCPVNTEWYAQTSLSELSGFNLHYATPMTTVRANPTRIVRYTADVTHQVKATVTGQGTQSLYVLAGANYPAQLTITDLGKNI